jgi:hypothetical protein
VNLVGTATATSFGSAAVRQDGTIDQLSGGFPGSKGMTSAASFYLLITPYII